MSNLNYDSFGEPLPQRRAKTQTVTPQPARNFARLAGAGLFWALVAVILTARIVYFDSDVASTFAHVAAVSRDSLRFLFGA